MSRSGHHLSFPPACRESPPPLRAVSPDFASRPASPVPCRSVLPVLLHSLVPAPSADPPVAPAPAPTKLACLRMHRDSPVGVGGGAKAGQPPEPPPLCTLALGLAGGCGLLGPRLVPPLPRGRSRVTGLVRVRAGILLAAKSLGTAPHHQTRGALKPARRPPPHAAPRPVSTTSASFLSAWAVSPSLVGR